MCIDLRLLLEYVRETARCLAEEDLGCARSVVSNIVRRDVRWLDGGRVASAAVESLFENLVDSFTSPLLYYAAMGPLGSLFQRVVNALDSALGYRDEDFRLVGWFSAKADTLVNYVPARLTALTIIALCPLVRGSLVDALRTYLRYRRATQSVNAGHPMSAASGCLGVRLERVGAYVIGEGDLPSSADVLRGVRLATASALIYCLFVSIIPCLGLHWLS